MTSRLFAFELVPKRFQLFRPKVREDFPVHFDHRREFLAGEADHFVVGGFVSHDVDFLVVDPALVEPADRLVAPPAIRFDEEPDPFWFHAIHWRTSPENSNAG